MKKKYRIKEITKGKIKLYYPQNKHFGIFFTYTTYCGSSRSGRKKVLFNTEEMARQYIKDRIQEDIKETVRYINIDGDGK